MVAQTLKNRRFRFNFIALSLIAYGAISLTSTSLRAEKNDEVRSVTKPIAPRASCAALLTTFAFENANYRDMRNVVSNKFWLMYKNDEHFEPWFRSYANNNADLDFESTKIEGRVLAAYAALTAHDRASFNAQPKFVDLSGADIALPAVEINRLELSALGGQLPITRYEAEVLQLRKGDTVKFSDETFVLGEYIGGANTTHVWRIAHQPGRLLRIPFFTKGLRSFGRYNDSVVDSIRAWNGHNTAQSPQLPNGFKHVEIFAAGKKGEYSVVREIKGAQSGGEFLAEIAKVDPIGWLYAQTLSNEAMHVFTKKLNTNIAGVLAIQKKLKRLKEAQRLMMDMRVRDFHVSQLLWDEELNDWILVDW